MDETAQSQPGGPMQMPQMPQINTQPEIPSVQPMATESVSPIQPMQPPQPPTSFVMPQQAVPQAKSTNKILLVGIVLLILIAVVGVVYIYATNRQSTSSVPTGSYNPQGAGAVQAARQYRNQSSSAAQPTSDPVDTSLNTIDTDINSSVQGLNDQPENL